MKSYTFHVHGMHCNSCVVLTEGELKDHASVEHAVADLKTCCVEVRGDFGDKSHTEVAQELSPLLEKHGYKLSTEKEQKGVKWSDFGIAVPATLGFMAFFVILQKLGLVNLVSSGEVNYGTAFLIGLIASVSTCMAVVGSLVLSVSANYAKEGDKVRPQVLFHIGRLAAFFLLGGIIGAVGSAFQLGTVGIFVMTFVVALVMLILGINLLDIFPWAKKLQPTFPKFISNHLLEIKKVNHTLTPVLLGIVTFVLPCGFTQSMQLYSLTTGSFWGGATTMFVFALGTLPVLALLSFGSLGIRDKATSSVFFKTAGLVVIIFALMNLVNSFVIIGFIPPIFNF
ncbi:MAG: sulfite exporter TauE/SafE family protein [Candidatus Pacebacteria bacterium]|nr:sulfite exporter TauE/SafE family protein [Candidatus Paceibacterota bacterium]MBP9840250.1 sulfite exporter TauE/SafE family protein [Candidatus Paceibacterota bacterium]